ncbi:MAG TPA: glycosyltransferase [Burkholderiales bacterium]
MDPEKDESPRAPRDEVTANRRRERQPQHVAVASGLQPSTGAAAPDPAPMPASPPTTRQSTGLLKQQLRTLLHQIGLDVHRRRERHSEAAVSLRTERRPARGSVLMAYIQQPFLPPAKCVFDFASHTNFNESVLMARAYLDAGFDVDVIDFRNAHFVPNKHYDIFVSARTQLERIAQCLNSDCIRIAHLDTAHFVFNNHAAYARVLALQRRRGVTCMSVRIVESNRAIEHADCAALLGGDFAAETYAYANKPIFRLPIPTVTTYPFPRGKDYRRCRRRFLWFGSSGLVHKGLDLVLEAFAEMPQYELIVCGPVTRDSAFESIYRHELYHRPNIRTIGWVDVTSPQFTELAHDCAALIFPSCAESQSASTLTCMQAGILPVVTREAGIDTRDFNWVLNEATVEEIQRAVEAVASLSPQELENRSRAAWEYARTTHTAQNYAEAYGAMLRGILAESGDRR